MREKLPTVLASLFAFLFMMITVAAFKVAIISIVLVFLPTLFPNHFVYNLKFQIDASSNGMNNCFFSTKDILKNESQMTSKDDCGET